jgi:purine catabolism regulator
VARKLTPLGTAHPAGERQGRQVALVEAAPRIASESLSSRVREVTARWEAEQGAGGCLLALSGPAFGVASLPRAAREAAFVAAMQVAGDVARRAASFGSVGDLGAVGLLYHLRDAPELRGFVAEVLGALPAGDRRGTLRATLRAFLESGGSQVEASQRLGIHRNTLAYRLRRIGELVGRDVADPAAWLSLHLAIRASDMLEAVGDER